MDSTGQMPGARAARPGSPGMGGGNVPFAGGVMSGNLGQQNNPQPGRMNGPSGGVTINMNSGPPPEKPPGQPGQAGGPGGGPGGPPGMMAPPQQPLINPQAMMDVYNAFFAALKESVESGKSIIGGIY